MQFNACEFMSAGEALQHVNASGRGVAICYDRQYLVVEERDAHLLEENAAAFAYLTDHQLVDGTWRVMSVPTNT